MKPRALKAEMVHKIHDYTFLQNRYNYGKNLGENTGADSPPAFAPAPALTPASALYPLDYQQITNFLTLRVHYFLPFNVFTLVSNPFYPNTQPVKKLEYVYFTIYHYYSRQSYFPDSLSVRLKSMYLLAMGAGGWLLLLQLAFLRFIKNAWFISHPVAMMYSLTVYTAVTFIFYRIFIVKEYDQKILSKFESAWNDNPNKKRDLFLALFVALVPYIVMVSIKYYFPRN